MRSIRRSKRPANRMNLKQQIRATRLYRVIGCILLGPSMACATDTTPRVGAISGRVLPEDATVRIIAKLSGTNHQKPGNLKAEVTLTRGGNFHFNDLPPGNYDLLFLLQGESKARYIAFRWSEVIVEAGKITEGIHYRLTPVESDFLIDEILVTFVDTTDSDARKAIRKKGFIVKDKPFKVWDNELYYTIDIPDDMTVDEAIQIFRRVKGVSSATPNHLSVWEL